MSVKKIQVSVRAGIVVLATEAGKISKIHIAEGGALSSASTLTLKRALIIILAALGIARLSLILAECLIQGSLLAMPTIFDSLTVFDQSGVADVSRSLQQASWLKEAFYSLVAIFICILLNDKISLRPVLNFKLLKNVFTAAVVAITFAFVIRAVSSYLDPAAKTSVFEEMAAFPIMLASYLLRTCVLAPIEEEFIYRGLVLRYAGNVRIWYLAALSILPWALDHVISGGLWQVTIALTMGPIYFWIRQHTGHFGYAVISHAIFNIIQIWP